MVEKWKNNNNKNSNDLLLFYIMHWISFLILKTHVFFKDENNAKPLAISSEHVFS